MKYRDIIGYSGKKEKKKIIPIQPESSVVDNIKEEFGYVNEGPAYEYANHTKKIEKLYKAYWNSVKDFSNLLVKKGLKKEGNMFIRSYTKQVKKWNDFFIRQVRKLL